MPVDQGSVCLGIKFLLVYDTRLPMNHVTHTHTPPTNASRPCQIGTYTQHNAHYDENILMGFVPRYLVCVCVVVCVCGCVIVFAILVWKSSALVIFFVLIVCDFHIYSM